MVRCTLLVLFLLSPLAAAEEPVIRRDAVALARVEAAEKLAYLPRRAGLAKLRVDTKLVKPGRRGAADSEIGEIRVHLEEPEPVQVDSHGPSDRWRADVLSEEDGERCVRRDLVDFAVWPPALYPDLDLKSVEISPASRDRVRIHDHRGTGVEVIFGRNGLPKQHIYYERGERGRYEKLEWEKQGGKWLLVRRIAQGGKDETRWDWRWVDGLWLPRSMERRLGKLRFRIELGHCWVTRRPEGEPPKRLPRSDPEALSAIVRAERLWHTPGQGRLQAVKFRIKVASGSWGGHVVVAARFEAPDTLDAEAVEVEVDGGDPEVVATSMQRMAWVLFLKLTYARPPICEFMDDGLVTKHPTEERTYVVSDREGTEVQVRLHESGHLASLTRRRAGRVVNDLRWTFCLVEGRYLLEESRNVFHGTSMRWTWERLHGIWLPTRMKWRDGDTLIDMTASDYEVSLRKR